MKNKTYTGQSESAETKLFDTELMKDGYDTYQEYVYGRFFTMSELLKINRKNKKVLEVGCGSGAFGRRLAKKGFNVTGIDLSKVLVKYANKLAKDEKISYRAVAGNVFNYKIRNFDIVMCVGFLHHFEDLSPIIKKLGSFLKKDGKIVIMEPNGSNPVIKLTELIRKKVWPFNTMASLGTMNETNHSAGKYLAEFKKTGFEPEYKAGFIAGTKFGDYGVVLNIFLRIKYFFESFVTGFMDASIRGTVLVMRFKREGLPKAAIDA
jgi:2-polyprenyl-3-methyl-5-hydroxy-6-metoxy-1,4-benzoquinol methylase